MAARWDRSPVSRKMFMAAAVGGAARGSAAQAAAAAAFIVQGLFGIEGIRTHSIYLK